MNNWEIPVDDVVSVSAARKAPDRYPGYHPRLRKFPLLDYLHQLRIIRWTLLHPPKPDAYLHFRFDYETTKGLHHKIALFPLFASGKHVHPSETESVGKWIARIRELRKIKGSHNI